MRKTTDLKKALYRIQDDLIEDLVTEVYDFVVWNYTDAGSSDFVVSLLASDWNDKALRDIVPTDSLYSERDYAEYFHEVFFGDALETLLDDPKLGECIDEVSDTIFGQLLYECKVWYLELMEKVESL